MGVSTIEWTEMTWNPIVGCSRVGPGCDNCYAIKEARRKWTSIGHYSDVTKMTPSGADWTGVINVAPDHVFNTPLKNKQPTLYFVNSMSDLFAKQVSVDTIKRVFAIMNSCPHHQFQVLTKRPKRAAELARELTWTDNIWIGTSIETDKYAWRAAMLATIPAAVRFVSAEPLLGPLPSIDLTNIDWLIAGGESGPSRDKIRRMEGDWVRDIRDRCIAAKTAFFLKQWGNWSEQGQWSRSKKDNGRMLDGREWSEMPVPRKRGWGSISEFRAHLSAEHQMEDAPPTLRDQSPRVALRETIWRTLRETGPLTGEALRLVVLSGEDCNHQSARMVNYHAWSLVDLQRLGFVDSYIERVPTKRGTKNIKMYRATKPRVRVLAA